ncbi:hypothetical protein C2G38_2209879 [Gigaspora rosea]|uniref:Uncharacterized protein n=1 Tax=Gigaspora rosea TaxID=44941 RepID=A0A397UFX8_9GLOM|nr:hypothetical protein C2G38_2209879 [Gigaspora rosea]
MFSINTHGTDCTNAECIEYCNMPQIRDNETPSEWMKRIWERLTYFRENNLLPNVSKKYLEARRLIRLPNSGSYAPKIGIAICFSWYNYDNEYALHRYELWMQNAIKKTKRAREIGKKIQACIIIQRKFIEYYYRPDGLCASELAQHYKLLWMIREEIRQDPKGHCFAIVNNK